MTDTNHTTPTKKQISQNALDEEYRRQILARLTAIQAEWDAGGPNPWLGHSLSTTEYVMVAIAAQKEQELSSASPVMQFLMLQNWQQRWILERRGLQALVGTVIG